ncbi:MAG: ankyrin repeat domain-containing protein [Leptospirales bacterium]|nr:ankyrin repeat domain-containing protein [Leptospirales bacterium]
MANLQQKLFDAASELALARVKKLIEQGASLKKGDEHGCDVLYHAVSCLAPAGERETHEKQKELVAFLLSKGAEKNRTYSYFSGWTPLITAATSGHTGAIQALLDAGADFETADNYGYTPLMRAALSGQAAAVQLLLDAGADVQKKVDGSDALALAREGKKEDSGQSGADFKQTIELLLGHGAKETPKKKRSPRKENIPDNSETLQKMQQKFGAPLPPLLASLCNYWDAHSVFFSGSFEIDEDPYGTVKDWFRGIEAGWSRIKPFGIDGIHSIYALWLHESADLNSAPIVYLSGEGEGTTVLAGNWEDFLAILASNREWEPFDQDFLESSEENEDENADFCAWLKETHGILPTKNPLSLMKKAKAANPDFQAWLGEVIPG